MKNSFLKRKQEMMSDYSPYSKNFTGMKYIEGKRQAEIYFKASETITPNRFVWHISYPCYRSSILNKGIIPEKDKTGLVFVNNQIEDPHLLWPIAYDDGPLCYGWDVYGEEKLFSEYDFWRIDCQIAGFNGYRIDPYLPAQEVRCGWRDLAKDEYYLCRQEAIPSNAIKLFKYRPKSFKKLKQFLPGYKGLRIPLKYKEYSGVVSVGGFNYEKPYYLKEVIYKK
jgi:hypothetical protein